MRRLWHRSTKSGLPKLAKFPVFFPVSREFGTGERFARACVHRHQVLRFFSVPHIAAKYRELRAEIAVFEIPTSAVFVSAPHESKTWRSFLRATMRGALPNPESALRFALTESSHDLRFLQCNSLVQRSQNNDKFPRGLLLSFDLGRRHKCSITILAA